MRKLAFMAAMLAAVVALPSQAQPVPLTVHNTGVNASNILVAPGAQAAFWALSAAPVGATEPLGSLPFRYFNGAYFADTATAAWVSPQASGSAGVGGV